MPDFDRAIVTPWRGYRDDVQVSAEILRQVRLIAGLSRERLARRAEVSCATIIRAERGRDSGDGKRQVALRSETLERIAKALGVTTALLIRRTEREKRNGRNHEHPGATVRDGGAPGSAGTRRVNQAIRDRVDGDAVHEPR